MDLYVDYKGEIDIWALAPRERKLVGKDTQIRTFLGKMAKKKKNMLVLDRSPESDLVELLLGNEILNSHPRAQAIYNSKDGYHIVWLPWGLQISTTGYDFIIALNPPYFEMNKKNNP